MQYFLYIEYILYLIIYTTLLYKVYLISFFLLDSLITLPLPMTWVKVIFL